MRNNGCRALTLQTVLSTPEKQTKKREERVEVIPGGMEVRKSEMVQSAMRELLFCEKKATAKEMVAP